MYSLQNGRPFLVQQICSGVGVFDGTEYGRAKAVITNADPNAIVRVSARLYGVLGNAYTIEFYDSGAGVVVPATTVTQIGAAIRVTLRRSALALLATAAEVAAAINATPTGIVAVYNGTGNGVVAVQAAIPITNVALGYDPALRGPNDDQYLWYYPAGQNGGFFYFEQMRAITIRQFEALFTVGVGTFSVTVSRVNLNSNLEPITAESVPIFVWSSLTTARPDIAVAEPGISLLPMQALQVTTSGGGLTGLVRFEVDGGAR
jgi:hypothetical protein